MRRIFSLRVLSTLLVVAAGCVDDQGTGFGPIPDAAKAPADLSVPANGDGAGGGADLTASVGDGAIGDGAATDGAGGGSDGGDLAVMGNACTPPTSITVSPAALNTMVIAGKPFTQGYTATAHFNNQPDVDLTKTAFFASSDPTLGTMNGGTFTWAGTHGGSASITALACGVTGSATLTLALQAVSPKGGVDPNASMMKFTNAQPTNNQMCNPTLVYPPDGVLLPPNTNVIEVHFLRGSPPNNLFEVAFSNGTTDLRLYTTCSGNTPADGMLMNGGCIVELSQSDWSWLAQTNRDGQPVKVTVRGVGCDGSNAGTSATRQISFGKQDLLGTLYYWASLRISVNGAPANSGGIFRYDFGVRGQMADPVLTPDSALNAAQHNCVGCHSVSRDGRKMVFDFDDNDDDDEYGDVHTDIYDIAAKTAINPLIKNGMNNFPPGYHTWNRETSEFLLSDGNKSANGAFRRVTSLGVVAGMTTPGNLRGTTPDWSPDDSLVVFAVPLNVSTNPPNAGFWMGGTDLWFAGAGLYVAPWNAMTHLFGAPTPLVPSVNGNNSYYPSFSPEGTFIAFNQAASGPNFHNPLARVSVVAAMQGNPMPVDLARLNDKGAMTNSWARWAPFVQDYMGGKILWMTFSSTRNYGLRIINDGKVNCYPAGSPIGPFFNQANNCDRAQIWMAAIRLDANGVMQGQDPSLPAFWLPFQDLSTNNHLAQWAQRSFDGTCKVDVDCAGNNKCCVNGGCTTCASPPPPPPPPMCQSDANCARGQCCQSGTCKACPSDGGIPMGDAGTDGGGGGPPPGCNTCIDCNGQACIAGKCDNCTNSAQCCAPLVCFMGQCVPPVQ